MSAEAGRFPGLKGAVLINGDGSYTEEGVRREIDKLIIAVPAGNAHLIDHGVSNDDRRWAVGPKYSVQTSGIAYLYHPDIPLFDPPQSHAPHNETPSGQFSKTSDGGYGVDGFRYIADDGKENIVYDCEIPPWGTTSIPLHVHGLNSNNRGIHEHYLKRSGSGYIFDGVSIRELLDYEKIKPFIPHFIIAGGEGLRQTIIIDDVVGVPTGAIHQHLPEGIPVPDLNAIFAQIKSSSNYTSVK